MLAEPRLQDHPFEVLKVGVGGRLRVLVLSTLCGVNVHFLGSSRICGGDRCVACKAGLASKYAGYCAVSLMGRRRLLRLTSTSAQLGLNAGLFQPGMVLEVEKLKERKPISLVGVGDERSFDRDSAVSAIALLSIVARLHGLPGLDLGWTVSDGQDLVKKNACSAVKLAMEGVLS